MIHFPPVEYADENGLLAIGGDLSVDTLVQAYSSGIFPWPILDDETLCWFSPDPRAVLILEEFRISKRLVRIYEQFSRQCEFRFNSDFATVIEECARSANRRGQAGTWITSELVEAYCVLHQEGYAHSVECYRSGTLVGGLYGVAIGAAFAGESMFYHESNASKCCLVHLVKHLITKGALFVDCQQLTPLLEAFGAREIPRAAFLKLLTAEISANKVLF